MSGTFVVYTDKAGEFRFLLKASNGQKLLSSEGYRTKSACLNGIESVKKNGLIDSSYMLVENLGSYRFYLKAQNGQRIAWSEQYDSAAGIESAVEAVKRSILHSKKEDLTNTTERPTKLGSVTTFLQILENIETDRDHVLFYRGHSNHSYSLIPSIYRNQGWIKNEDVLFKELILKCPGDFYSDESTFQSLVKMQHYSLPTRLLDITSNPLIALYFASSESPNNGEVVVLRIPKREIKYFDSDTVSVVSNVSRRPEEFSISDNKMSVQDFNSDPQIKFLLHEIRKEKPHFEPMIKPQDLESVLCVKPKLDNARIVKQDGAFLLFGINKEKQYPAKVPKHYLVPLAEPIIINSEKKRLIRGQLSALGITEGSIYPEIERVASHIRNSYQII